MNLLLDILLDEQGGTLAITRKTANTLATAAGMNTNYAEIEAIVNGDIDATNIEDGAITAAKLATDAVETLKIKDANVTTAKIADSNVTTAKIADANVTAAKLASDAVETAKIKDAAVTTAKLADTYLTNTLHDTTTRHPLTVGGTGAATAAGAYTNIVVPKVYDSGYFAIAIGTSYAKTHSLGTTKVMVQVYFSDSSDGSGFVTMTGDGNLNSNTDQGTIVVALTTTTITIRTGATYVQHCFNAAGSDYALTSGYARIVILALE